MKKIPVNEQEIPQRHYFWLMILCKKIEILHFSPSLCITNVGISFLELLLQLINVTPLTMQWIMELKVSSNIKRCFFRYTECSQCQFHNTLEIKDSNRILGISALDVILELYWPRGVKFVWKCTFFTYECVILQRDL